MIGCYSHFAENNVWLLKRLPRQQSESHRSGWELGTNGPANAGDAFTLSLEL